MLAGAYSGATLAEPLGVWLDRWPWIAPYGQPAAIAIVALCLTYVSVVIGELVPKRIALNDPERIASALAPLMRGVAKVLAPAVWLARSSADGLLRLFGLARDRKMTVTEDEVRSLVAEGTRAGVFMPKEREMIEGVLRLADRTARAIMTPRTDVVLARGQRDARGHRRAARRAAVVAFSGVPRDDRPSRSESST